MIGCAHGTGWEADDRQGNGACLGNGVGLFHGLRRPSFAYGLAAP
jgi:hypothetical protein